ncbi:hypothetical protein TNCV_241301 [Trichonephila clavipes]|nr:hypothetical protein TNCV_241301 [Trichonephila clavipes]
MTQRTAPWEKWHLERGFELLRTFGLPPDSAGARDGLTSMSWLLDQLVYNLACLVVPGGAWMGSCIADREALQRPLLVAESRASPAKLVLRKSRDSPPPFSKKKNQNK